MPMYEYDNFNIKAQLCLQLFSCWCKIYQINRDLEINYE